MQVVLVYLQPFRRNSPLKCVSLPKIAKNSLKPDILVVHGHLRSSTLTFLRSSSPVLVMINSMSVSIYSHFHVGRANNSRITPFKVGWLCFSPLFVGQFSASGIKFCIEILETLSYHKIKTRSLCLTWAPIGTGLWETDTKAELPYT